MPVDERVEVVREQGRELVGGRAAGALQPEPEQPQRPLVAVRGVIAWPATHPCSKPTIASAIVTRRAPRGARWRAAATRTRSEPGRTISQYRSKFVFTCRAAQDARLGDQQRAVGGDRGADGHGDLDAVVRLESFHSCASSCIASPPGHGRPAKPTTISAVAPIGTKPVSPSPMSAILTGRDGATGRACAPPSACARASRRRAASRGWPRPRHPATH